MRVVRDLDQWSGLTVRPWVTLGNFDGLHLGHRKILAELTGRSKHLGCPSVVVTFDPHPRKVLNPGIKLKLITSMEHRLSLLAGLGIDWVLILRFDEGFAKLSAEFFIRDLLFQRLSFSGLMVGKNYAFGKDREGDVNLLSRLSLSLDFKIDFVEPVRLGSEIVSSSLVRRLIGEGQFSRVSQFLDRPYSIFGTVVRGRGLGAQIGYATANLELDELVLPPRGVYAVEVEWRQERYLGLANLGVRPTFGGRENEDQLEIHLLDFDQAIYGDQVEVFFVEKIRDEICFKSSDELRKQIELDEENVRSKFLRT